MRIFNETIQEISSLFLKKNIKFVLARFDCSKKSEPADLDLLVMPSFYQQAITVCEDYGYHTLSHDGALGGRIKGMQINLVKPCRTKVDLHKDFTWRKSQYLDLDLVWKNLHYLKLNNTKIALPVRTVDVFLVMINIIFEKTYINKEDFTYLCSSSGKIFNNKIFENQAEKYHWSKTLAKFQSWFNGVKEPTRFPIFLPVKLIFYSYIEKFLGEHKIDVISLLYYIFFRFRYKIIKILPYE